MWKRRKLPRSISCCRRAILYLEKKKTIIYLFDLNFMFSEVQMYKALSVRCKRCTKKKNKKKIVLRCMAIGTCAVQFLHFIPL